VAVLPVFLPGLRQPALAALRYAQRREVIHMAENDFEVVDLEDISDEELDDIVGGAPKGSVLRTKIPT
jgi:hypothetical protein